MKTIVRPSLAQFFSAGQCFVFHRRIAFSSRLMARPLGRRQEKPRPLSSRHTPDSEYRLPPIFSISLPTRASVHRSVAYPCAKVPASSAATTCFFSLLLGVGQLRRPSGAQRRGQGAPSVHLERLLPAPHRRAARLEPARDFRRRHARAQQPCPFHPPCFQRRPIPLLAHDQLHVPKLS